MTKVYYPAVIDRGEDGGFGVHFPDLDGCVSAGDTADQAVRNAEEALALHLEAMAAIGDPIPQPSEIGAASLDEEVVVYAYALIGAEEPKSGERVNVWLPKLLLQRIDREAQRRGQNRSTFLKEAAQAALRPADIPVRTNSAA